MSCSLHIIADKLSVALTGNLKAVLGNNYFSGDQRSYYGQNKGRREGRGNGLLDIHSWELKVLFKNNIRI